MKLFTKYSRINIIAPILIFLAASIAFYFALNYILLNQVDEDLKIEKGEITTYVKKYDRLPEIIKVKDQVITYTPVFSAFDENSISTIDLKDFEDKEKETFRQLNFGLQVAGQWYKISVSKSLEETDDLIHSVLLISFSTILLILIATFIINRFVLKKMWSPFYQSLEALKHFRINKDNVLSLPGTGIDEFRFMNATFENLTQQAKGDHLALKTFSENASHEIQTPIAIIRSKLDLLIQDESLTQKQSDNLQSAYNAIQKLTTLNHHLLLLAKIENNQFDTIDEVNLEIELKKKLADFSELWEAKSILVNADIQPAKIKMNRDLADILLNNVLSNATKHNYSGGSITIKLNHSHLTVNNSSNETALDDKKIFQRFYKPSSSNEHNGLGLSIIKQIVDASGFTIDYNYKENLHSFTIFFT